MSTSEYKTLTIREETENLGYFNDQDYGVIFKPTANASFYMFVCPVCGYQCALEHDVTIKGGFITIKPSIGCPNPTCYAHMYVVNSKVQVLSLWKTRTTDKVLIESPAYIWK